ncbi:hypothetical protein GCM10028826_17760 [Mucilaginibacter boryungensis]
MAQNEAVIPPSNRSTATLEKNLLFYATTHYTVSQQGSVSFSLPNFFDGNYQPQYSGTLDPNDPYIVTIEGLPNVHVQAGAWIGWTTRYYNSTKFKIEVYNVYDYGGMAGYPAPNTWVTVANETNYGGGSYIASVANVSVSKIRFTFYNGTGPNNNIGISELFFIHPEATVAFDNLMVQYDRNGNVGIGTPNSHGDKLAVNGTVHAKQVNVDMVNWADYVFKPDYHLPTLSEVKTYIDKNSHLPEIPSAQEVEKNGLNLGEMNRLLLKKVEELMLYLIEQNKKLDLQQQQITKQQTQQKEIDELRKQVKTLLKKKS